MLSTNWEKLVKKQQQPAKKATKSTLNPKTIRNKKIERKIITTTSRHQINNQSQNTSSTSAAELITESSANPQEITTTPTQHTQELPIQKHQPQPQQQQQQQHTSSRQQEVGLYLAIDCEFVGVGPEGSVSELARVSIVNFYGNTIYDTFVKPIERVTDWRTWVSGVSPKDMQNAITFKEAQWAVSKLIQGRILVGHAIEHDMDAMMLSHPRTMIRDTAKHPPFRKKYAMGKTPSLKKLAKEILGFDIQSGEHSSVEDARATMMIYKSDKKEFERLANWKMRPSKRAGHERNGNQS
ncbi:hypothetical protein CANARDRAFT_29812 [[Candida] arabinofermentans NRRL YB-2248]|uniref:RNA exonuclease 4 n=1 Tax=[Candida] arabinofermentans NRRL YB-2248 TaxID=983967 RepID=A0A1E4SVQ3_9ASCO|nr:hypothetical protein CANARDRAFT_29812 [[Candida] arabinofermentans NRRL YB-2248]